MNSAPSMTTLTVSIIRGPLGGQEDRRVVNLPEWTIGRGKDCEWSLTDPQKSLSRRHCVLRQSASGWEVCDLSTNGTFLNGVRLANGLDQSRPLRDGDRLRMGDFEIEAQLSVSTAAQRAPAVTARGVAPFGSSVSDGFGADGARPIPAAPSAIPDDWDRSIAMQRGRGDPLGAAFPAMSPDAGAAAAVPAKRIPDDFLSGRIPDDFAPHVGVPATAATIPDDFLPLPKATAMGKAPEPVPLTAQRAPGKQLAQGDGRHAPEAPASATPAPVARPLPAAVEPSSARQNLLTFLAGADLPADFAAALGPDPDQALRSAGALLRVAVSGLRSLLLARGEVKREFRIEQTLLHNRANNALKFAPTDELALLALLDPRQSGVAAIESAVKDLTEHEMAMLAATQAAARHMLDNLDPSRLEVDSGGRAGLFGESPEKRLWNAYRRHHAKMIAEFEDDFDSVFGVAFARAYERALGKRKD